MDYQSAGTVIEGRYLKACQSVDRMIAPEDEIRSSWNLTEDVYMFGGRTALKVCHQAMAMAGKLDLQRILDFPCGHGRALRYFRAAYPDADIFASDINEPGVEFCRTQFGATPFPSYVELEKTDLPGDMDLIWCGSLLTHLDERRSKLLIHKFLDTLALEGICVFTTHGRFYPRYIQAQQPIMERGRWDNILRDYYRTGYGYHVYPGRETQEYGLSMTSPGWIFEQLYSRDDVTTLFHAEKAWHGQHNVTAIVKRHLHTWFDPTSI